MPYRLLVGVDWSTTTHQVCVLDPEGTALREFEVEHRALAITQFVDELVKMAEGRPEAIVCGRIRACGWWRGP